MGTSELPDEFREFLKLDSKTEGRFDIASCLLSPEKKGDLISIATLVEEYMSTFIMHFVARPEHAETFRKINTNNLTFSKKINLIKRILQIVEQNEEVRTHHIAFIDALRKLRNIAAHSYRIQPKEVNELATDSIVIALVSNFPHAVWARVRELQGYLQLLSEK